MPIISIVNNKGGLAKTSSVANIGACLSHLGHKVLIVDSDPQTNLTQHFGYFKKDIETSIFTAYKSFIDGDKTAQLPLIKHTEELYIAPSQLALKKIEMALVMVNASHLVLKKLLAPLKDEFDFILIDCPPSMGMLTNNAIVASDHLIIPIEAELFSMAGIDGLLEHINEMKEDFTLNFNILGAFMTKYDSRNGISKEVLEEVTKIFGEKLFPVLIRKNVAVADAQANGEDVFSFSRKSNSALDYGTLTTQIINRIEHAKTQKV